MGGANVKIFDFAHLADLLCLQQGGQRAAAEERLAVLRDSGKLALGGGRSPLLSGEFINVLNEMISNEEQLLRNAIKNLEFLYTLQLVSRERPTVVSATMDEVIEVALREDVIRKPNDWVVILMLCAEQQKPLTPTALINYLENNKKVPRELLPTRPSLARADFMMTHKNYWPNWQKPANMQNELFKQRKRVAEVVFPLIQVLSL